MPSRLGVPSLVIMRVVSRFRGTTGVLVVVESLKAFLEATVTQIRLANAGGDDGGRASLRGD